MWFKNTKKLKSNIIALGQNMGQGMFFTIVDANFEPSRDSVKTKIKNEKKQNYSSAWKMKLYFCWNYYLSVFLYEDASLKLSIKAQLYKKVKVHPVYP